MGTDGHTRELLNIAEVGAVLGLSRPTVRRLIAQGIVPTIQLGGRGHAVRVRREDLERLLEARARDAAA